MSVKYICRHCNMSMGQIEKEDVTEYQLGFHFLTPEERMDILTYGANGDVTVKIVCDYCKQALERHPELSLIPNPLQ